MAKTATTPSQEVATSSAAKKPRQPNLLDNILAPSRAYIVEHIAVLLTLALIIISAVGLFNIVLFHFVSDDSLATYFIGATQFETMVLYLAIALVMVPAFLLFYTRTRKAERLHTELVGSRARRRLGYVFQVVAAVFIVGYVIALAYSLLYVLVSPESTPGSEVLETVLSQLFTIAFIAFVATFVSRMSPGLPGKEGGK